jgi:hypothetical protein
MRDVLRKREWLSCRLLKELFADDGTESIGAAISA